MAVVPTEVTPVDIRSSFLDEQRSTSSRVAQYNSAATLGSLPTMRLTLISQVHLHLVLLIASFDDINFDLAF